MNCYYHPERVSCATCHVCGKALCKECAETLNPPICLSCLSEHISAEKAKMIKTIIFSILLGIGCWCFTQDPMCFLFAGVPFGWAALTAITPNIFLFMPIVGWVIYFAVKVVISLFIGWIALPIKIYQWYRIFSSAKRILG